MRMWCAGICCAMISPAAVISLCDDIVQRTMISSHCSDCGIFHLSIMCGCPHPTVIPSVAWESSRQAHFAPLDCHVAKFVAPRNDKEELNCCALYLRQFTSFTLAGRFPRSLRSLGMTIVSGMRLSAILPRLSSQWQWCVRFPRREIAALALAMTKWCQCPPCVILRHKVPWGSRGSEKISLNKARYHWKIRLSANF